MGAYSRREGLLHTVSESAQAEAQGRQGSKKALLTFSGKYGDILIATTCLLCYLCFMPKGEHMKDPVRREAFKSANPMKDPETRKKWQNSMRAKVWGDAQVQEKRQRNLVAYHASEEGKLKDSRRTFPNSHPAVKAEHERRRGRPNHAARKWWESLPLEERQERASRLSEKIACSFKGVPASGFIKAHRGVLSTRFGDIRYDSSWERCVLSALDFCPEVLSVSRDYCVSYEASGVRKRFLVDFLVEVKSSRPVLVEVKCPLLLTRPSEVLKLGAAREFCEKVGWGFVTITDEAQARRSEWVKKLS